MMSRFAGAVPTVRDEFRALQEQLVEDADDELDGAASELEDRLACCVLVAARATRIPGPDRANPAASVQDGTTPSATLRAGVPAPWEVVGLVSDRSGSAGSW